MVIGSWRDFYLQKGTKGDSYLLPFYKQRKIIFFSSFLREFGLFHRITDMVFSVPLQRHNAMRPKALTIYCEEFTKKSISDS